MALSCKSSILKLAGTVYKPTDADTEAQSSEQGEIVELDDEDIELLESD